jgi:hypothetical protein
VTSGNIVPDRLMYIFSPIEGYFRRNTNGISRKWTKSGGKRFTKMAGNRFSDVAFYGILSFSEVSL